MLLSYVIDTDIPEQEIKSCEVSEFDLEDYGSLGHAKAFLLRERISCFSFTLSH